jgi:hypothetical protein
VVTIRASISPARSRPPVRLRIHVVAIPIWIGGSDATLNGL